MSLIYCPNCGSANSSVQRECWICQKKLVAPAGRDGRPLSYPQKMRLVRFEESAGALAEGLSGRIVYVKSVVDKRPVKDFWQAAREQRSRTFRRLYAGTAAGLTVVVAAVFVALAAPPPAPAYHASAAPRVWVAPATPVPVIMPPPPTPAVVQAAQTAQTPSAPMPARPPAAEESPSSVMATDQTSDAGSDAAYPAAAPAGYGAPTGYGAGETLPVPTAPYAALGSVPSNYSGQYPQQPAGDTTGYTPADAATPAGNDRQLGSDGTAGYDTPADGNAPSGPAPDGSPAPAKAQRTLTP